MKISNVQEDKQYLLVEKILVFLIYIYKAIKLFVIAYLLFFIMIFGVTKEIHFPIKMLFALLNKALERLFF
jgi:hypothetical protein